MTPDDLEAASPDVYAEMIAAGFHPVRATQESLYSAFITITRANSVRDGWYEGYCDLCGAWQTSGEEPVVEQAAYEHINGHVDDLERAGWAPRSALLAALAEAQRREELMRPVVEAARAWREMRPGDLDGWNWEQHLAAAVDIYETQTGGTDGGV